MRVSLRKNERGVGAAGIIAVIVVILAIAGVGYYVISKNKDSGSTATNQALQSECEKYYDDKDFCRFAGTWNFGGEQKMTITSTGDGSVTVFETDDQGNTRMTTIENGVETAGIIVIDNTTYMKNADEGNWLKLTSDAPDVLTTDPTENLDVDFDFESEAAKDTTTITKDGKEACGNLTCFKYTISDSDTPGESTTLWFDDKDYKLRRMTHVTSEGTSSIAFEYEVETITEPSPVVEMPGFGDFDPEAFE